MGAIFALIAKQILVPALLALGEKLIMSLFGWLKSRDDAARNVALGEQRARADRLAAEEALRTERKNAEDRARRESDAALAERLRASLGRGPKPAGG